MRLRAVERGFCEWLARASNPSRAVTFLVGAKRRSASQSVGGGFGVNAIDAAKQMRREPPIYSLSLSRTTGAYFARQSHPGSALSDRPL